MLKLVKMERKYAPQLFEMMDEWSAAKEKIIPWAIRKCDYHDLEKYIDGLDVLEGDETHVPDSTFFCLDTERNIFVGAVNIRHYLKSCCMTAGTLAMAFASVSGEKAMEHKWIALALQECDRLGIRRVLMCCDRDNVASARTIQKNGGILKKEIDDDGVPVQRYWIER